MSATQQNRVVVLVKALPQRGKSYGETVWCARGVTADGHWKQLFPVRFRHLQGNSFKSLRRRHQREIRQEPRP